MVLYLSLTLSAINESSDYNDDKENYTSMFNGIVCDACKCRLG